VAAEDANLPRALVGGDTCDVATVINAIPFSATGDTCAFGDDYDEVCDPQVDFPGSPDVVYQHTPASDVTLDISLCLNSAYDTKLYVYENTCPTPGSGVFVACNEDFCATPSLHVPFASATIQVPMIAGNTYYIVVDGTAEECGAYTLDIVQACNEGSGDCFTEHPTAGCADTACCALVCDSQLDPFCCDPGGGEWDQFCVEEAFALCDNPPPPPACPPGTLVGQPATQVVDGWIAGISDSGWFEGPLRRFESFGPVFQPICDVHWWGLNARNSGTGFSICDKAPDQYLITFYPDNLGEPDRDNPVCTYTVLPQKENTSLTYAGFPLYSYSVDLENCCVLSDGWVSIQGIDSGDDCVFLWMSSGNEAQGFHFVEEAGALTAQNYDLSLCLTGTQACVDPVDCDDADICTWDRCLGDACAFVPNTYGDVTHDGFVSLSDVFCQLDGYQGDFSQCPFEDLDIQPCAGNGVINLLDIFAVLDAFEGTDPCCDGLP